MIRGKLFGVGVGPGDKELITVKALRILNECDIIAVPKTKNDGTVAYNIIKDYINNKQILKFHMPMTNDLKELEKNYLEISDTIEKHLNNGKNIAFITIGDPTIYSTYMNINKIIQNRGFETEIIPAVTSFCSAAAMLNVSLCERNEPLMIIPASYENIEKALDLKGTKVIMKTNKSIKKIKELLDKRNLTDFSTIIENCGMENERIYRDIVNLDKELSYFSIIIVKE